LELVPSRATLPLQVGLSRLQALLGFVSLNPTYNLPVLLQNAKPNNGRFRNQTPKVSISINLALFLASDYARMKLHADTQNQEM
jgi:hypothetical protein